ncbi:MAG: hypothetical protein NTV43_04720 [Methylococcales bacterium]|nr:hypothetical protein [Methylococcales bacterium]
MLRIHLESLSVEEIRRQALAACEEGRGEAALQLVRRALAIEPNDWQTQELAGVVFAQLGDSEQAAKHWERASQFAGSPIFTGFQAGRVWMRLGQDEAAKRCWLYLADLEEAHPLRLFATGLQALMANDWVACRENLEKGISANTIMESLNNDMRGHLRELDKRGW